MFEKTNEVNYRIIEAELSMVRAAAAAAAVAAAVANGSRGQARRRVAVFGR